MPKTAVVNRRRKRRTRRRRNATSRRSYGAAVRTENARRRRRSRRRRRNPATGPISVRKAYSSGGYRRQPNPDGSLFDFSVLTQVLPAATGGVMACRWGLHMAGEMEDDEPDIKHAVAAWISAALSGQIIGQVLNDRYKGLYAYIAALGFAGDLFARKTLFKDSDWLKENLYLGEAEDDDDEEETDYEELDGFQDTSNLGQVYYDANGNPWVLTAQGYQPAGQQQMQGMGQPAMLPPDPSIGVGTQLAGFQDASVLGKRARAYAGNSFGYTE